MQNEERGHPTPVACATRPSPEGEGSCALALCATGGSVEVGRLRAHPCGKAGKLRIGLELFDIGQPTRDLDLAVAGVDGAVADLVQPHGAELGAAAGARHEMVAARAGMGRYRPLAQRTGLGLNRGRIDLARTGAAPQGGA